MTLYPALTLIQRVAKGIRKGVDSAPRSIDFVTLIDGCIGPALRKPDKLCSIEAIVQAKGTQSQQIARLVDFLR